ncbi:type II secretion system protein GspG [Luminiphilus sp. nBUS_07]|uniref:type II secretion system protein GspG n=1 Tax=Luminiphilus sp. nBUS_07 TaxID=3395314 RepID=UPI003EB726FF
MHHPALPLFCLALVSLLTGCASTEEQAAKVLEDTGQVAPNSNYKDVAQYPGNVTCGKYLTNDYQGFPIYKDFVVLDTVANLRPLSMDVKVYCTENSAAALNEELQINYEAQKTQIDHILQDFRDLATPLEAYISGNPSYPWTEQGLQALVQPATTGNPPINFPENGYISSIPNDPWSREYHYVCEPFAGIKIPYKLQSFGADGVPGGSGINADIKHVYLPYFEHINRI